MKSTDKTELLSLHDVCFARDGRIILEDINLTVREGDFLAITGPNGGGKTTLLRLILGLLKPTSGHIHYAGNRPFRPGYLPQKNSVDSQFPITVSEVIASGLLGIKDIDSAGRKALTQETLHLMELDTLADRPIGRISGGQLQRALLGRAIVSHPDVLILDEPLSYLDRNFENHLYTILSGIASHTTILMVSHQLSKIDRLATRHLTVNRRCRLYKLGEEAFESGVEVGADPGMRP